VRIGQTPSDCQARPAWEQAELVLIGINRQGAKSAKKAPSKSFSFAGLTAKEKASPDCLVFDSEGALCFAGFSAKQNILPFGILLGVLGGF